MKKLVRLTVLTLSLVSAFVAPRAVSAATTITFDDVGSLTDYAWLGVTFTPNASIWTCGGGCPSVLVNPSGGPVSVPSGLQFGNAGGELGSIFFASGVSNVSIWALSGPGDDLLNAPTYIKAFDANGTQIGEDNVDPSLQFDLLSVNVPGIHRLDLFSPLPNNDVWDDLTFTLPPPSLKIVREGNGVSVQWPAFATNYLLQATTNLTPPIVWGVVTNEAHVVGNTISVNVETDKAARFFRLRSTP